MCIGSTLTNGGLDPWERHGELRQHKFLLGLLLGVTTDNKQETERDYIMATCLEGHPLFWGQAMPGPSQAASHRAWGVPGSTATNKSESL